MQGLFFFDSQVFMVGALGGTGKYSSEEKGNNLQDETGWDKSCAAGLKTPFLFSHYSILTLVSLAERPACENCSLRPDVYECSRTGQHGNPAASAVLAFALFLWALLFLTTYI